MLLGKVPSKTLLRRSSVTIVVRLANSVGIVPVIFVLATLNACKRTIFTIKLDMCTFTPDASNCTSSSFVNVQKDDGSEPVNLLTLSPKLLILVRSEILSGIVPVNSFLYI